MCDKKSLNNSVSDKETMLVIEHIPAQKCILSNRNVGCRRVKGLI